MCRLTHPLIGDITDTPMMKNSLQQYIDLFCQNRELIDRESAPLLNAQRDDALCVLNSARLSERGDEGYEKTSVNEMFAPDYGVNIGGVDIPVNPAETFRCGIPTLSTRLAIVANDRFHPTETLVRSLPEGVIFTSLRDAAMKYPELVGKYYNKIATTDNVQVALNTLLAQQGVFLYIPSGTVLDKPLQLVNIFRSGFALMAVRRVLIVVEEGASGSLLVCDHTAGDPTMKYLSSQVTELYVGEGATFDLYDIEEASEATTRHAQFFVRQLDRSNVTLNGMSLSGGVTRNDYTIDIDGEHCETLLAGMAVATGNQHIDNASEVRHNMPHCHSRQLFKYVLDDKATGAFEGGIIVAPTAPFTEAYQANRNVLASEGARMHTRPQLLIYNDEVKCSHGATTGQLDRDALFYMRTRGIPEREARTMLMQAFMTDVIDTVKIEGLRDRLTHLVDCRFHHREAHCADCSSSRL